MTQGSAKETTPVMRSMLPACMGGMCRLRDHCERHVTSYRAQVVERLCARGAEQAYPVERLIPEAA